MLMTGPDGHKSDGIPGWSEGSGNSNFELLRVEQELISQVFAKNVSFT